MMLQRCYVGTNEIAIETRIRTALIALLLKRLHYMLQHCVSLSQLAVMLRLLCCVLYSRLD